MILVAFLFRSLKIILVDVTDKLEEPEKNNYMKKMAGIYEKMDKKIVTYMLPSSTGNK